MNAFVIRSFDIILSALGILCALPFILIIFLVGFIETSSPLFFQARVGRLQKSFILVKFRTMSRQTESVGTHLVDAASITKIGGFLRKTKLDELPQLFNVLLGHMSLVGPRPCLPNQTELIHERASRGVFQVRPGITGLAQINDIDMSTPKKLSRYDQLMIRQMTPCLYLKLILLTAFGRGRGDRVTPV